jgi:hypothetical protein
LLLLDERVPALERDARLQLHRPAEAGHEGRVVGADVAAPGAVGLLQAQRFDGAVAGGGQAVRRALLHDGIEEGGGELDRGVQLPAQLAHIGDAERPDGAAGDADLLDMGEGEGVVAEIGSGQWLEDGAALGPKSERTAKEPVTSVSVTAMPSGMLRVIQSRSWVAKPVPVVM